MIPEIKKLENIADILHSEGPVLRLHQLENNLYLSSNVSGGSVYYSTTKEKLLRYLHSEITLKQLYLESEDLIVSQEWRTEVVSYVKEEFTEKISCGAYYYKQYLDSGMVREDILELVNGL